LNFTLKILDAMDLECIFSINDLGMMIGILQL
jgi:hypothetical protein